MSKELEALEHIYYGSQGYGETDKYYKYLKNYLQSIDNTKPSEALEELEQDIKGRVILAENRQLKLCAVIKQALIKSQENARLKEILINGFKDKNGVFHEQTYLAFIDDEWCICDLKTDEWFLVKEVF